MLKVAYQLGVQAAFEEAGLSDMNKEAAGGKAGFLSRAWTGLKNMSPAKKALLGGGVGLAGLGAGLAAYPREDDPSVLQRVGDTAKGLLGNQELMTGLTQSLSGMGGGGGFGLTPGDGGMASFPPSPEGIPEADYYPGAQQYGTQYPPQYSEGSY